MMINKYPAIALVALLALGGCASFDVPDAINPGKWDFFADEEETSYGDPQPIDLSNDVSAPDAMQSDAPMEIMVSTDTVEAPPPPATPTVPVEQSVELIEPAPAMAEAPAMPVPPSLQLRRPDLSRGTLGEPFSTVVISSGGISSAEPTASPLLTPTETLSNAPMLTNVQVRFPEPGKTTDKRPQESVGGMLRLATIYFNNNSATLDRRDLDIVAAVAQLRKERGGRLFVVGHASSRTRDMEYVRHTMANFKISSNRANTVARALSRAGVAENHIQVHSVSDTVPLYYEVMPSGEAGNRRVEIYLAP